VTGNPKAAQATRDGVRATWLCVLVTVGGLAGCTADDRPGAPDAPLASEPSTALDRPAAPMAYVTRNITVNESRAIGLQFCVVGCVDLLCCEVWEIELPKRARVTALDLTLEPQMAAAAPVPVEVAVSCIAGRARACDGDARQTATGVLPVSVVVAGLDWSGNALRISAKSQVPGVTEGTGEAVFLRGTIEVEVARPAADTTAA
jgi:hypothetical protein